ncbi:MAG: hypothetical protein GY750_19485 [Lentisphaerae bacterium]|nr:hypothetical protein [Lentisphaerota bacterium]MCP4103580.1 hypothetical protein [Lentisphaerota bacterium]
MFKSVYYVSFMADSENNWENLAAPALRLPEKTPSEHMVFKQRPHKSYPGFFIPMIRFNWNLKSVENPYVRITSDLRSFFEGIKLPAKIFIDIHGFWQLNHLIQVYKPERGSKLRRFVNKTRNLIHYNEFAEMFDNALSPNLRSGCQDVRNNEVFFHFLACQSYHFAQKFTEVMPSTFTRYYSIATKHTNMGFNNSAYQPDIYYTDCIESTRYKRANGYRTLASPTVQNDTRTIFIRKVGR